MKHQTTRSTIFELSGVPALNQAFPLALQHVVAMIVGCVTPAIIVSGVAGLSEADSVILIQAALVTSALATLLQLFPFIKTRYLTIGSGLPVIMGISFAYVPSMQSIAEEYDVATILGAMIAGGIVAVFVGLFIRKIRKFFPPLITGTVVFTIGLSLYPTAINYMAGGVGSEDYGSWQKLAGRYFDIDYCNGIESFWKRNLETGIHSDRYHRWIYHRTVLRNGRLFSYP